MLYAYLQASLAISHKKDVRLVGMDGMQFKIPASDSTTTKRPGLKLNPCAGQRKLAKLNSEDKKYFVFLQLVKPVNPSSNAVWIGLSRDTGSNFHWTDGTLVKYTNWGPGLPDNNKNSTKINSYSGLWENEEFDFTHPFVCGRGEENKYITCKTFCSLKCLNFRALYLISVKF